MSVRTNGTMGPSREHYSKKTKSFQPTIPPALSSLPNVALSQDDLVEGRVDQQDAWTVVNAFFQDKGLVMQQLKSFDMFVKTNIQVGAPS